jgi:hypothetical protein
MLYPSALYVIDRVPRFSVSARKFAAHRRRLMSPACELMDYRTSVTGTGER